MTKIKRILAGSLALVMSASVLTACGKDNDKEDKDGFDAKKNAAAAEVGNFVPTKAAMQEQKTEGSEESKNTFRIYCWNDEIQGRFRSFYSGYDAEKSNFDKTTGKKTKDSDDYLTNGMKIEWVVTPNDNNAYQNKLDADLATQADSDNKIDMFLIEADYALKYVNGPFVKPVKDIGITADDLADQYKYTQQLVTDADGDLQAVTWQATPGLFAYRRDIAKEVLGTDDPVEVQAKLADWAKFDEAAKTMKDKGYFMLSGYDDSYRTFSNNVKAGWVNKNQEIVIDDALLQWVDQTKSYTDSGYNNKTSLWSDQWGADQGTKGKVFGFFYSTWGINFTLAENAEDTKDKKDGLYGKYAVCEGPQNYYWGGSWICCAAGSDNTDIVADVMKELTMNKETMVNITEVTQDYTNTVSGMEELAKDFSSEFLGGQNHIALFSKTAPGIDMKNAGAYDQGLNESFQGAMKDYFTGAVKTKEEAIKNFYKAAIEKYPGLKMPS